MNPIESDAGMQIPYDSDEFWSKIDELIDYFIVGPTVDIEHSGYIPPIMTDIGEFRTDGGCWQEQEYRARTFSTRLYIETFNAGKAKFVLEKLVEKAFFLSFDPNDTFELDILPILAMSAPISIAWIFMFVDVSLWPK
ncbi:hypothetical protein WDW89_18955, partial [Deltaproteobacteria bacterium TL4]